MRPLYRAINSALVVAAAVVTAVLYPGLPDQVAVHWDAGGAADGFGPRSVLWLVGPGMMAFMLVLGWLMPKVSPHRFEIDTFRPTYDYTVSVITAFLGYCYGLVLANASGHGLPMERALPVGLFVLLILLGNPMGKVQRNFFIGVRTPWTIASPRVWHATHRFTARLMVASGAVGLVAVAAGAPSGVLFGVGFGWAVAAILYSLFLYKKLDRSGQLGPES